MKKFGKKWVPLVLLFSLVRNVPALAADSVPLPSWNVGGINVTLLPEGDGQGKAELLLNLEASAKEQYIPGGSYPTGMNAFLIQDQGRNILVDTGLGKKLFTNLALAGVAPDMIHAVLITHMHGDHIGGLLKDGQPAFPNAQIYISREEKDYWLNDSIMNSLPEGRRGNFTLARQVISAYGKNIRIFQPEKLGSNSAPIIPLFQAYAAFGHTPGHTVFLMQAEGKRLLFWGDIVHATAIQVPEPKVAIVYDVDPQQAIATRREMFAYASGYNIAVAGAHIPSPGIGNVVLIQRHFQLAPWKLRSEASSFFTQ